MYQVGTQAGNVHNLRQGEGLATVLKGANADDYAAKYAMLAKGERDKALAARKSARDAALAKMSSATPDFFFAHQQEMGDAQKDMMEKGIAALKAGSNDPYSGTSPADIEFQKAVARMNQMATVSKQIKEQYGRFQQDIQAKGPDYFDPNTLTSSEGYFFNKTLAQHMDDPTQAPIVQQRKPMQNSIELASGWAGKLMTAVPKDGTADPNTVRETIRSAFRDPSSGPQIIATFTEAVKGYSDKERADLENEALQNGLSAPEMYALKMTNAFIRNPQPYSVNDALKNGDLLFKPTFKSWRGAESFSSGVDKPSSMKAAMSVAKGILNDDPRALSAFGAYYGVKQDPAQTEKEYIEEVQHAMALDLYNRAPKDREAGQTAQGKGDKDLEMSTDKWLEDMKSGKREIAQEAAGVLSGAKMYGNLYIQSAQTLSGEDMNWPSDMQYSLSPGEMQKAQWLRLKLKTPVGTQVDKDEMQSILGVTEESGKVKIIEKQGEEEVYINLDKLEPTDQLLRTLYQTSHKQSGVLYKGPGWTSTSQLQQLVQPKSELKPEPAAKAAPIFNF